MCQVSRECATPVQNVDPEEVWQQEDVLEDSECVVNYRVNAIQRHLRMEL